jgi:hypothetical protein
MHMSPGCTRNATRLGPYRFNTPPGLALPPLCGVSSFSPDEGEDGPHPNISEDLNIGKEANMQQLKRHLQASCLV